MDAVNPTIGNIRRAALLCASGALAAVIGALAPGRAWATDTIDNVASVSFSITSPDGTTRERDLVSNLVRIQVKPTPAPADLQFRGYVPGDPSGKIVPVDGGQCLVAGQYQPMPGVHWPSGEGVDPANTGTEEADSYEAGDPVVVWVGDTNRNADPEVREVVEVELTTSTGDAETLHLMETGPDTGIFATAIQSVPMPPAPVQFDCVLSLEDKAIINATYRDPDFPLDEHAAAAATHAPHPTSLRLGQGVSRQLIELGDFVQYSLVVSNPDETAARNTRVTNVLPPGFRYEPGSLRVADAPGAAPTLHADGRTFDFATGDLEAGASVRATFIASVGPGATGQVLRNEAVARADGNVLSNLTDTVVRMRESLNSARFTLLGRITEGACDDSAGTPVPGIRVLMEDGTYASTDGAGQYHIEGVRPGTHVVQLDLATLPPDLEVAECNRDTRHAGRPWSQFVEAQGGSLWRADFRLHRKVVERVPGEVGARLSAVRAGDTVRLALKLDGNADNATRVRATVLFPDDSHVVAGSATLGGAAIADPESAVGTATFDLGDPGAQWARTLEFALSGHTCPEGGFPATAMVTIDAATPARSPPIRVVVPCESPPGEAESPRVAIPVAADPAQGPAASPSLASVNSRAPAASDQDANGDRDWFAGQLPGREFLFPGEGHNPRSPGIRIVLKTLPSDSVTLRLNGKPVDPLNYDGAEASGDRSFAIRGWSGVDLTGGDNLLQAEITDASGTTTTLERVVHFAASVARAELVPEKSSLVADGIQQPVIAVRMLDQAGHPVRKDVYGEFSLNAPYRLARDEALMQVRQLAGKDAAPTSWRIEGDDGIAYITLAPTGTPGNVELEFDFGAGPGGIGSRRQKLSAWLKAGEREWVVVGFASGSIGYETLAKNMEALGPDEDGRGVRGDGRAAFYAKGRVLGKWMLTLAYDSGKPTDELRNRSLLSVIDPGQYYTLYGDGSQQGYDAASARKLYLKLERDQFYALFGDFQTGLDRAELSRYQRAMTGAKVAYRGPLLEVSAFAAQTAQHHARDEIQGDGTSGLYRLSRSDIVLNSERIRLETRERYHSEQVVASRELARHVDYDIDYDNGTLSFREPIASRDFDFNPVWIVADYETTGSAEEFLNAGGRAAVHLLDDRLEAGATYVRDEDVQGRSDLFGIDAKFRLSETDEFRAEAAATRGDSGAAPADGDRASGSAWLVEWQHRAAKLSFLAYARRQAGAFGLGQQNASEAGTFKAGVQGQYALAARWMLRADANRIEDLATGATGDMVNAELAYRGDEWGAKAGLRWARDHVADGDTRESRLVTLGADKYLLDHRLQLSAETEFAIAGANDSVDFPTRLRLGASYAINKAFRLVVAQELTDGEDRDTSTTRLGFDVTPWANAHLTSTLNQSRISEYGPRTFALFGLDQKFLLGKRWGVDLSLDASHAFNEPGQALPVEEDAPIRGGGLRDGGALTSDFTAVSAGLTYRAEAWSWNARMETRQALQDRYGFTTALLRQARDGVAMSASLEAFSQRDPGGASALLANAQMSYAYRPFASHWSMLDKLEFRLDEVQGGAGNPLLGQNTLAVQGDARSRRLVNNFALNYASQAWADEDSGGVLSFDQRSQLSLYYGAKYVLDSFGPDDYAGFSDLVGAEWRFDLGPKLDLGLRASVLHSWSQRTIAWAFGPNLGFTPFANAWVSVGYNIKGFNDRDFENAHHTAQGPYLVFRVKFDQQSLGLAGKGL